MSNIPFQTIDWNSIEKIEYKGETGIAIWQTMQYNGLRVRIVEYSKGYLADHWCKKGHIVYCLEGEFVSELSTGEKIKLAKGETYIVSDELSSHRSSSERGVKLLIIDGDFLHATLLVCLGVLCILHTTVHFRHILWRILLIVVSLTIVLLTHSLD